MNGPKGVAPFRLSKKAHSAALPVFVLRGLWHQNSLLAGVLAQIQGIS